MGSEPSKQTRWFFEEVHAHQSSLRSYLRRAFPWLHEAEDIVQDTMARTWQAAQERPIKSGKAFLFASARHAALDLGRRHQVVAMDSLEDLAGLSVLDDGPDAAETASRREELAFLAEAIRALPERCRQVLTLRKIYGLPQKEIAARLGISEHTVEVHTANGIHRCAAYLRERGLTAELRHDA